jgi:hypothetical protein
MHNVAEILWKVAFNTIPGPYQYFKYISKLKVYLKKTILGYAVVFVLKHHTDMLI